MNSNRAMWIGTIAALALVSPHPPEAAAQSQLQEGSDQPEISIVLEGNVRPVIRLAIAPLKGMGSVPPSRLAAAREFEQTVRADLDASGIFSIQGPEELAVLDLSGDMMADIDQYRSLGNEMVLDMRLEERDGRLLAEGRLVELSSRQDILAKRYRGDYTIIRRVAHTLSDDIVLQLTGKKGLGMTSIAFWSDRSSFREIYVMDYDGYSQRQITAHKSISMSPSWSPTLDGLAYVSYFTGPPGIHFADLATGRKSAIVVDDFHNGMPSFSPDGKTIAFARSLAGNWEIFLCNRDGSNIRRLTHSPRIDTNPMWSPTGREIAFTSARSGRPHVYMMDAEGANLRRVTFDGDYNDGAAWNPAGTHLVYSSRRRGVFQLALTDLVTLETQILTSGSASNETPSFSPDGRKIAYSSNRNGQPQIYVVDTRTHSTWRLTSQGRNWSPSWSGFLE